MRAIMRGLLRLVGGAPEEEAVVVPLDAYRRRLEDDARAKQRQFVARRRKHQSARARLMQFHTGGNDAA